MPSSSSISTTSTITVSQRENLSGSSAWASVGNGTQTCLVAYSGGGLAFQPVFNPAAYSFTTDPVLDNRRDAFTFWRTDYMDRSWKNSALGTAPFNISLGPVTIDWNGTLGSPAGAEGATGTVEVGIANAFPLGYYSAYNTTNIMFLPGDSVLDNDTQYAQLSGGFNVACVVTNFDNDSPSSPLINGPLNTWNGYSGPLSNLQNIAPGNRGGN